jgi:vacuolar protein sorting-associated protein 13A/C
LESLERKLSYEDIRFYRSIARSQLKKDLATGRKLEEQKKAEAAASSSQSKGWGAWLWGSRTEETTDTSGDDNLFGGTMTEQQRKELYEVLDYDEKSALAESLEAPRDALKLRVGAQLKKGSFALKSRLEKKDVISIEFDVFQATAIQRTDGLDLTMSLGGFGVFDGTTKNTLYPQIVRVASNSSQDEGKQEITILPIDGPTKSKGTIKALEDPFLQVKFEQNPLDERADTGLTVKMRPMEIIYHRGYIEAIYRFFKPPESQLESVEALLVSDISILS